MALVFASLAAAWSWLGSWSGIVSFGHAIFFGIGGYAVAVSNLRGGSPWYGALGGALASVIAALICGLLCLRGRGYVFTLVTLVAGAVAEPFVAAHAWVGTHDAFVFPPRISFFNLQFDQKWPYVLLALCVLAAALGVTVGLRSVRIGYYLRALRANAPAARAVGVAALPPRLAVLAASAFVTSVVGSFFAEYALAVTPHAMFALSIGFDIALIGIVAGPARPWGTPLVGAVYALVAHALPLHPAGAAGVAVLIVQGAVVVSIALLRPEGLFAPSPRRRVVAARSAA